MSSLLSFTLDRRITRDERRYLSIETGRREQEGAICSLTQNNHTITSRTHRARVRCKKKITLLNLTAKNHKTTALRTIKNQFNTPTRVLLSSRSHYVTPSRAIIASSPKVYSGRPKRHISFHTPKAFALAMIDASAR